MDLFDKIEKNRGPLGKYMEVAEGYYMFPKLEGEIGPRMKFQGKEMIVWSLNNYLGLANHPEVRAADTEGTKKYGLAYPMGARMMSGQTTLHEQFEKELAAMVEKESAFVVNYGYQGIMSAIDTILDARGRDVIVYDEESHACIIDGARMYSGRRFKFKHNDIEDLDKQLARATKIVEENGVGGILVISEGVFGMRGDQGKLKEIVDLKSKYQFRLLVDDAHGFGTLGKTGAGAGEEQGCQDGIDIYFSTFAKSMAMIGGFLAADKDVIDFLRYNMRSQIFAKSLPMPFVVGGLKRLELLKKHPELKDKLWENVNYLQNGLRSRGFDCGDTNTCVTPVYMHGEVEEAMAMVRDLRENYSIFCSIVVYPVIPKGMIILRLIPTAVHTKEDIDQTLAAFETVSHKLKSGQYRPAVTAAI
ncbi:MAG: aminotransferase class I/II-fold pyridoxal phosphate-dependent enzyme [Saprospiraceae bacterium]